MTTQSVDVLRSRIVEFQRQLQGLLQPSGEVDPAAAVPPPAAPEEALREAVARSNAEHDARYQELTAQSEEERRRIEGRAAHDLARIETAFSNASQRVGKRFYLENAQLNAENRQTLEKALSDLKENQTRRLGKTSVVLSEISALREANQKLRDQVAGLAAGFRVKVKDTSVVTDASDSITSDQVFDAVRQRLTESTERLDAARRERGIRFARSGRGFLVMAGAIALMHAAGLLAIRKLEPGRFIDALWIAPATFLGLLVLVLAFRSWMKQKARRVVAPLFGSVMESQALLLRLESSWRSNEKQIEKEFQQEKTDRMAEIKERFRDREGQAKKTSDIRMDILKSHRAQLIETVQRLKDQRLAQEAERLERESQSLNAWHEEAIRRHQQIHADQMRAKNRSEKERRAGAWKQAILDFDRMTEASRPTRRDGGSPWGEAGGPGPSAAQAFPDAVYLGDVRFDVGALLAAPDVELPVPPRECGSVTVPLDLSFPAHGSLFIHCDPETRDVAFQGLFSAVLRILCAFPPGKAKFTLFDPVGLGQSFSALMHLADYEESLVGGRIWTETAHFERKLAELTEHIEKVIQKYLRNRYSSIGDYNRNVGSMAEAYRFLVVANFPTGFSDLALERLASIVTSGARCGVHTLLLRDRKQKLPASMSAASLRGAGLILQAVGEGFQLEEEPLKRGILTVAPPPPPEALTALLHDIGRRCAEAERVELSFELVAPKDDRVWTHSTETGVRIPLGRASADRLQYLDLGRGTAQHALIAGKTGSGKSTLFHVMVTNAALWYSPRELELYLIDFKKGVEFKTYAVHGLPHARVVAIESDREFGLSVLRRIDRELVTRAEHFRKSGVQNFEGYRDAGAAPYLPRTLLLIDEFQEFFVEEDAIAQEAALLLDRIVRQGRAFGIHVLLGSQTLGGSYTLARATLGQMTVRIALQCNEADSYLILNDDNAAARLLSRPGEAIYNDMSGMVEGNNPFQVAWLPDDVRERFLMRVKAKAEGEAVQIPEPMMVFEGNVPADIRNNLPLKERLAHPFRSDRESSVCAWVGEANAIKGPTEVRFANQGSSNLMIVGQQREAALSVVSSTLLSLAAACSTSGLRFVLLDGSPPELAYGRHFSKLAETMPHRLDVVEYAQVPRVMQELDAEVSGRMDGTREARQRIVLILYDLQRFRMLRQRSELDFSGEEQAASPDRSFGTILSEGPAQRIHTILWADSLNNLNRTLNRKTLREFQMRILFQMSGADSSELIDTPLASTLGLYRGLLFLEEHGTWEKFRPYAIPDAETLEDIRKKLHAASAATGAPGRSRQRSNDPS